MNEVTIGISSPQQISAHFLTAWESETKQGVHINFESDDHFWKTLTLERWKILKAMTGIGAISINELAQIINQQDLKILQNDVKILRLSGLLEITNNSKIIFPYSAIHVDFMLQAA